MYPHAMQLAAYLERIGFEGTPRADLPTLKSMHLAHQRAVPFENLDVQLRRPLTLDLQGIYDKIVCRRRGGRCYEMNGVMGWALKEIGFDVLRFSGGVMRERGGDGQLGNHLCLLVRLDQQRAPLLAWPRSCDHPVNGHGQDAAPLGG